MSICFFFESLFYPTVSFVYTTRYAGTSIISVSTGCMRSQLESLPIAVILNPFVCPRILFSTVIACRLIPAIQSVSALHCKLEAHWILGSSTSSRKRSRLKRETCSRDPMVLKGCGSRSARKRHWRTQAHLDETQLQEFWEQPGQI